jgi:ArsR family transcriptional regulator
VQGDGAASELVAFAEVMRALGDETRLRILRTLGSGRLCVGDLAHALGVSQPLVSHHLKALKHAGLVGCHREGPWVYYAVRREAFQRLGLGALWEPGGVLGPQEGSAP